MLNEHCTLAPTSAGVHMLCNLIGSNPATTFVAIVHKKISLLDSNGLIVIKSYILKNSHQSNTVSKFIPGLNLNKFQVGFVEFASTLPNGN